MLKIIDITKEYKVDEERILALDKVSIEFRKNEFVSILGPSGCGKTTLLNIIGGLDRYTSGDVQIDGISTKQYDDVDWDAYRNRRVGFVFQSYNLIPHMNILKNVAMSLTLAGVEREERRRRALEALAKVGLDTQAKKKPNQLSGGQMQRVAIARALVNNPEIILADEPTGALDSESGIQVMDLLKEVAEDRLVIMVTHNPMLAEQYSTRIVYLKDGRVEGDTMPYDSAAEEALALQPEADASETDLFGVEKVADETNDANVNIGDDAQNALEDAENNSVNEQNADVSAQNLSAEANYSKNDKGVSGKMRKIKRTLKEKFARLYNQEKSSMKLRTAIDLSWNNLLSKKGRTLLTSIAGSIGIIGIILVLALSNGAGIYINSLEENALSTYPIEITSESADLDGIMSLLMSSGATQDENFDEDTITVQKVLGNMIEAFMGSMTHTNDLAAFKKYIDANFDHTMGTVKYQYGTIFNVYSPDPKSADRYMKVNPYTEVMDSIMSSLGDKASIIQGFIDRMDMSALLGLAWSEMSDNREMLEGQYQLVGEDQGSRWPTAANEVVIVVNEYNRLLDYQLFILGLKSQDDLILALSGDQNFMADTDYTIEDLLKLEYKVMTNADYLIENEQPDPELGATWSMHDRTEQKVEFINEHAVDFDLNDPADNTNVKVVGIVRPKPGTIATSIGGCVGYTSKLTDYLQKHAENHPAVLAMKERYQAALEDSDSPTTYQSVISVNYAEQKKSLSIGEDVALYKTSQGIWHSDVMRELGDVDLENPSRIEIYCASFDSKNRIIDFIDGYNELNKDEPSLTIQYSDSLSSMMRFIDTMSSTLTGVLVAFAAISLVVSTIMIAIIIYTSVLERRKEIGVLRSIGARKKDISRVFLAESAILGGYSGIIGIAVSVILALIGSKVLEVVFNITGLMTISWWHCVLMFAISVVLSMLAGFVPSRIAAKKDPAIALRSE